MGLRPRSMLGHRDAFIAKIWKCWWYKNFPKLSHNIGSGPIILPTLLQIKVYGVVKNHICSAQNSNNRTRKIILTWFYEVHFNFWLSCDSLMPPWSPEHWSQILMMLTFSLWRGLPTLCKAEISKDLLCLLPYMRKNLSISHKLWPWTTCFKLLRSLVVSLWSIFHQCRNDQHHLMLITSWPIRGHYQYALPNQKPANGSLMTTLWWWCLGRTNGSCNHNTGCLCPWPHHGEEVKMTL